MRPRALFAFSAIGLAVTTAGLLALTARPTPLTPERIAALQAVSRGKPRNLRGHLEQLRQALPLPRDAAGAATGPGGLEDFKFERRAYPDVDIPLARIEAERAAFRALTRKGFPNGKGRPGTWVTVGPSQALYPSTPFRSSYSYVPTAYVAGGRTTSIAISPDCAPGNCTIWIGVAGGGVWRTKNALDGQPNWKHLSGPFGINAIGSITLDPNDATGQTVYAGTGEANASGDSAAGVGLYKSTDGGDTWAGPLGAAVFNARSIGSVAVVPGNPDVIYAASTRGGRGIASVSGGTITLVPGAPQPGLYKSIDGGSSWTFIHNGASSPGLCRVPPEPSPCSPRGVRRVVLDPADANTVYASSYGTGVWRSTDAGATWVRIKAPLTTANTDRPEIAVAELPDGRTRMYVGEGASGAPYSRLFRSDEVRSGVPVFSDLTSGDVANLGYGSYNYCSGQCWYDNFVYTPEGHPDVVYLGGSYAYGETGRLSNGRGVVLSTDAGVSFTDMTMDATDPYYPNGLHPDQHALVTNPNDPFQFFEANDGGVMRSTGAFQNVSSWCDARGLTPVRLERCRQLLSRVPAKLEGMNRGLSTLQFQSLSVSPFNPNILQGGTQDNGTWQSQGNPVKWINTMIGDGGQSGFDAANPDFRFHTFFDATPDVNFSKGDMADWNWIGDGIYGHANTLFYIPIISDPKVSGTIFAGTGRTVYRTKTWGMGAMSLDEFRLQCNEWFGQFTVMCGDFAELGPTRLTSAAWGDRSGGAVAAIERTVADNSTAWAATSLGRVFISKNVDAEPAGVVTWMRLDAGPAPRRFVTGIHVDPANANRAWVAFSGFNAATPTTPGHVFEVVFNPAVGTATWTDRSYDMGDVAITDVARDDVTGDLYASSDFGVMRLVAGTTTWTLAAPGMPQVEVSGLTVVPGARRLYAATHGLGAWLLNLR